jgi:hypothetical protein
MLGPLPNIREITRRGRPAHTKDSLKNLSFKQLYNQISQTLFRGRKLIAQIEDFDGEIRMRADEIIRDIFEHPLMKAAGATLAPEKSG